MGYAKIIKALHEKAELYRAECGAGRCDVCGANPVDALRFALKVVIDDRNETDARLDAEKFGVPQTPELKIAAKRRLKVKRGLYSK